MLTLAIVAGLVWFGATVKLGRRTFFGHVRAIWHSEEAQEMKEGVKETAGPTVKRVEHGIEAGYKAMKSDAGGEPAGSGTTAHP